MVMYDNKFSSLDASQEAELVASAQSGDRLAFFSLARFYHKPLYRVLFAMTGSDEEAARLVQDAFTRAWKNMPEFPSGRRFFPFLLRIARNMSPTHSVADTDQLREDPILGAVGGLRPDDRAALELRLVEGLRYEEIAALLEVPVGIAIMRIAQARGAVLEQSAGHGSLEP